MRKLLLSCLLLTACFTNEEGTRSALENMGFTDIVTHGHDAFACGNDGSCTAFSATSPAGKRVNGAVGCGMGCGKACTVRFH